MQCMTWATVPLRKSQVLGKEVLGESYWENDQPQENSKETNEAYFF